MPKPDTKRPGMHTYLCGISWSLKFDQKVQFMLTDV